jgi:hypothetical protein
MPCCVVSFPNHVLPCLALPSHTLSSRALTLPCPALPFSSLPCPPIPCSFPALRYKALPCSSLLCPALLCPAMPALLCSALPCLALPSHVLPCHAFQSHAPSLPCPALLFPAADMASRLDFCNSLYLGICDQGSTGRIWASSDVGGQTRSSLELGNTTLYLWFSMFLQQVAYSRGQKISFQQKKTRKTWLALYLFI